MSAYMQGQFAFLGVKSPERKAASKEFINESFSTHQFSEELVLDLWNEEEREFQYVALDYLFRTRRYWKEEHLTFFKQLILSKPWWDTVDLIASTLVGGVVKKYPALVREMDAWSASEDLWLQRSALLHQLKYKDQVDWDRLQSFILGHAGSDEFFLQKASGWSLRQYSKFQPNRVAQFIASNDLPSLTVREGSKYIN